MAWVISRLCTDCIEASCILVCPVDCIYGLWSPDPMFRHQLYIDPHECIDCTLCAPECPWEAIYLDAAIPAPLEDDVTINRRVFEVHPKSDFTTSIIPFRDPPGSKAEVVRNKEKWGLF